MKSRPGWRPEPASPLTALGSVAAPAPPPSSAVASRRHWAELDGHRGIAVTGLVVFNVYQFCNVDHFLYRGTPAYTILNSLDAMVPWLFALSAFLLFEPVARAALDRPASLSVRPFLLRRVIRLVPLYYLAVAVVWFSRQPALPGDWRDLIEHLTFTQIFDERRIFYTIGPAWAIAVEVIFCLLLALLIAGLRPLCARIRARRGRLAILVLTVMLLAGISLAWNAWSFSVAHRPTTSAFTTWFGPLSNLAAFSVGMAIAVLVASRDERAAIKPDARWVLRGGGVAILGAAFATRHANAWTGVFFPTIAAVGFGCVIAAAVLGPPDRLSRTLSRAPLLWLGTISYSVYVWHEPIMLGLYRFHDLVRPAYDAFAVDVTVVTGVSLLGGWLSYLLIQRPTQQLDGILERIENPPADRRGARQTRHLIRLQDVDDA